MTTKRQIIDYWLGEAQADPESTKERSKLWYGNDPAVDKEIHDRFMDTLKQAENGALEAWRDESDGALALVILLDQFSRNLYRRTPDAFKNDAHALEIAEAAVDRNLDKALSWMGRVFLYHPFHHAESLDAQDRAVDLFARLCDEAPPEWAKHLQGFLEYAREHRQIVERFGRFPHRNRVLGRSNTEAEAAYLKDARTYGQ